MQQGLLDIAYNRGNVTVLLLDNRTVGMTGGQDNPGSDRDIHGEAAPRVDFARLVAALGIAPEHVCMRKMSERQFAWRKAPPMFQGVIA
jgi:indolepyruvate ferredoxin oxidoreductase alpha subunit